MLGNIDAVATVPVKNLTAAKRFYQDTLGLKLVSTEGDEVLEFKSGQSRVFVYRSEFAGTNKATSVTWVVGDQFDEIVKALKAKGVAFEHYDMPGLVVKGDAHVGGGMMVAWIKDPESNVLCLVNG